MIRHGETEWSWSGQHAGRTDVPLTDAGMAAGQALAPALGRRHMGAAFSSPPSRAMRTAELAGLTGVKPDPDLMEWDYGGYEGMTEAQIRETRPAWNLWRDGVIPGAAAHPGETLQQASAPWAPSTSSRSSPPGTSYAAPVPGFGSVVLPLKTIVMNVLSVSQRSG